MNHEKSYLGLYKHTITTLAVLGPATALLVLTLITPPFCRSLAEMSVSLPPLAILAISIGLTLCTYWFVVVGCLIVEVILMEKVVRTRTTARWICALSWAIPWALTVFVMLLYLIVFYSVFSSLHLPKG